MRNAKTVVVGLVAICGALWLLWPASTPQPSHDLGDEFFNRFWIEGMPERMTDKIDILVLVEGEDVGAFQRTSAFEGDWTLFQWRGAREGRVGIVMLQTRKKHELRYRVSDKGCGDFDYCAKVKGAPRGAKRYFSMHDWVLGPGQSLDDDEIRARVFRALR